MPRLYSPKTSGNTLVWVIVCIAIIAGAWIYVRKPAVPPDPAIIEKIAEAPPLPTPIATPEPTPEPTPVEVIVEETPIPTPTPRELLTFAKVVQDHNLWPKEVALNRPTQFPAMLDGKVIGSLSKPAGSIFKVVKLTPLGVEIVFNNNTVRLPVSSTDLLARAEKLRPDADTVTADLSKATPQIASVASTATSPRQPAAVAPINSAVLATSKLFIETVRLRKSRIEGGDYDDKIDHINLRIKVKNPDPKLPSANMKCTIYIFAESILNRKNSVLLGRGSFACDLAPRAEIVYSTNEFTCAYDTTDARFGYKYAGWVVELKSTTGESLLVKASTPSLQLPSSTLSKLKDNGLYDKDFKLKETINPNRTNSVAN